MGSSPTPGAAKAHVEARVEPVDGRVDEMGPASVSRSSIPTRSGKAFRSARARAGLDSVRLHDLRHGFASLLVNGDTNPRVVSDLLGHAQVSFTLATYFHPDEDAAADAVAKAEKALGCA